MDGQTEHWSTGFQHESLATPEARTDFTKAMSKYDTQESAIMGGFNAIKMTGKPFKLPESIDKLDEKTRGEFTASARKLLNIEDGIASVDDLADVNLADGLPEGFPVNEEFANSFKQFAAEKKLPKSMIPDLVKFNNQAVANALQQKEAAKLEQAKVTNEALVKHFHSEEAVKEQSELVKRYFRSKAADADAFEKSGLALVESGLLSNPELAIPLIEAIAPLAAEGNTLNGKGGGNAPKQTIAQATIEENPNTAEALGWKA